jgi:hypothetical protein
MVEGLRRARRSEVVASTRKEANNTGVRVACNDYELYKE